MTHLKSFHQFRTSLPESCPQSRTLERCLLLIMIVMIMLLHTNVIQRAHWLDAALCHSSVIGLT